MEKTAIRKINTGFKHRFKERVGGLNMLPYIIVEDGVSNEVDGVVFTYADDPEKNTPTKIKVRNDGNEYYFIFHSRLDDRDYSKYLEMCEPMLAKAYLTDNFEIDFETL
jgi:hypothetical protein